MLCEEYPNTQQDIVELMLPYLRKHKVKYKGFIFPVR